MILPRLNKFNILILFGFLSTIIYAEHYDSYLLNHCYKNGMDRNKYRIQYNIKKHLDSIQNCQHGAISFYQRPESREDILTQLKLQLYSNVKLDFPYACTEHINLFSKEFQKSLDRVIKLQKTPNDCTDLHSQTIDKEFYKNATHLVKTGAVNVRTHPYQISCNGVLRRKCDTIIDNLQGGYPLQLQYQMKESGFLSTRSVKKEEVIFMGKGG